MRGLLRINVSRARLPLLVNRLLPGFLDLHPNVQLELLGDGRMIDIVAEEFDAGIRLGHFVKVDMVAVGLTPAEPYAEVGAPQLFERLGRPDKPQDLHEFPCILLRQSTRLLDRWQFPAGSQEVTVSVQGPLILHDVEACARAALRGVGLFRLPRSIVMHHLDQGQLRSVLHPYAAEFPVLFLYIRAEAPPC
jgi:DNA-binding transcriptional LysR family regulator